MKIPGHFFEPGKSDAKPAELSAKTHVWCLSSQDNEQQFPIDETIVSKRLSRLPRTLTFPDGAEFTTTDNDAIDRMLLDFGLIDIPSLVDRLESNWRWALASLVVTVAVLYLLFTLGLPLLAKPLVASIPDGMLERIDASVLEFLDEDVLKPSELSETEQDRVSILLDKLPDSANYTLVFRSGIGANALALPNGTIIITDELVKLSEHEGELLAVLAHESGHVVGDHGMRNTVQSAGVSAIMAWLLGDLTFITDIALVSIPVMLQQLAYSRNFEREADLHAIDLLVKLGYSPSCFADILQKIESSHEGEYGHFPRYLLSHPATEERARVVVGSVQCH